MTASATLVVLEAATLVVSMGEVSAEPLAVPVSEAAILVEVSVMLSVEAPTSATLVASMTIFSVLILAWARCESERSYSTTHVGMPAQRILQQVEGRAHLPDTACKR